MRFFRPTPLNALEQTDATTKCRLCATAKQWPAACADTSHSPKTAHTQAHRPQGVQQAQRAQSPRHNGMQRGQKAAERWKTDPNGDYAQAQRDTMGKTHRRNRVQGQTTRARIQLLVGDSFADTGQLPTRREIMRETGLSETTVKRHLRSLREDGLMPD